MITKDNLLESINSITNIIEYELDINNTIYKDEKSIIKHRDYINKLKEITIDISKLKEEMVSLNNEKTSLLKENKEFNSRISDIKFLMSKYKATDSLYLSNSREKATIELSIETNKKEINELTKQIKSIKDKSFQPKFNNIENLLYNFCKMFTFKQIKDEFILMQDIYHLYKDNLDIKPIMAIDNNDILKDEKYISKLGSRPKKEESLYIYLSILIVKNAIIKYNARFEKNTSNEDYVEMKIINEDKHKEEDYEYEKIYLVDYKKLQKNMTVLLKESTEKDVFKEIDKLKSDLDNELKDSFFMKKVLLGLNDLKDTLNLKSIFFLISYFQQRSNNKKIINLLTRLLSINKYILENKVDNNDLLTKEKALEIEIKKQDKSSKKYKELMKELKEVNDEFINKHFPIYESVFLVFEMNHYINMPNYKDWAFKLDDTKKTNILNKHGEKLILYFDRKNTDDITMFDITRNFLMNEIKNTKNNNMSEIEYMNLLNKFDKMFEDKNEMLMDGEELPFTDEELDSDKILLEDIILKKETSHLDYYQSLKKLNLIHLDFSIFEYKRNKQKEESSIVKSIQSSEEKQVLIDIFAYNNKNLITDYIEEITILDFDVMNLVETIYMEKFDKLFKKTIHMELKKRVTSNNISGAISNTSKEKVMTSKPQKDNFLELLKKEALSYAIEGFLVGMRKFEIEQGNKLSTYSTWWLKQRVISYIEKDSSLNKATKKVDNLKNYTFDDMEEENFRFHKYDNIKYSNYNFQDIEDMSNTIVESKNTILSNSKKDLMYDILQFFCKYKHIFMYHEYLLLKYDIFLENYIYFIDISKNKEITDCFFEDINIIISMLKEYNPEKYENLEEFTKVSDYHKIPLLLESYFNVENKEFLSVKRVLKQKLLNILQKIFVQEDDEENK